jgi:hypothetical protein
MRHPAREPTREPRSDRAPVRRAEQGEPAQSQLIDEIHEDLNDGRSREVGPSPIREPRPPTVIEHHGVLGLQGGMESRVTGKPAWATR